MAFNRKAKLRDNIEAIRTVFTLEKERRAANPDEREILSRYCDGFRAMGKIRPRVVPHDSGVTQAYP